MSRIGKRPVAIAEGVKVSVSGQTVHAEGPVGKLSCKVPGVLRVKVQDGQIILERTSNQKQSKALHGLYRSLIANMLKGVSVGFEKGLEIIGVGYGVRVQGNKLLLNVGFNAPVEMTIPEGLKVETPSGSKFLIRGTDKQKVGEFAAEVRSIRPPDPYKGKGIRYEGEVVRRKAGKAVIGAGVAR